MNSALLAVALCAPLLQLRQAQAEDVGCYLAAALSGCLAAQLKLCFASLCRILVPLGQSWSRLGVILGQSWGHLEATLGQCWGHLGAILGPSRGIAAASG